MSYTPDMIVPAYLRYNVWILLNIASVFANNIPVNSSFETTKTATYSLHSTHRTVIALAVLVMLCLIMLVVYSWTSIATAAAVAALAVAFRAMAVKRVQDVRSSEMNRALSSIIELLNSSPDSSSFASRLCATAAGVTRASCVSIWTRQAGMYIKVAEYSLPGSDRAHTPLPDCAHHLLSECVRRQYPLLTNRPETVSAFGGRGAKFVCVTPLPAAVSDTAAVLACNDSSSIAANLPFVVSLMSVGLIVIRGDTWKESVMRELAKLPAVTRIMCEVGPQARTSDVREAIVEAAGTVLNSPRVTLMNIDPCTGHVEHGSTAGVDAMMREAFLDLAGDILTDRADTTRRILRIQTTESDQLPAEFELYAAGIASILCCPIRSSVGATGALVAFYESADGASNNAHLIEAVTAQAAAMLSFALAIEQSRSLLDELAGVNQELSVQATVDGLTGLVNHRTLQQRLTELCKAHGQNKGNRFSLVMVDVDHFKMYNDTYGHQEGDIVLNAVARVLASRLRQSDFAARYGGEEFALVISNVGKEEARPIADRIRRAVSGECNTKGSITVSMGIAEFPTDGSEADEIIECADKALYHAKTTGRNRVAVWGSVGCENNEDEIGVSGALSSARNILVVEAPEQDQSGLLATVLEQHAYQVIVAANPVEATECLRTRSFDAALVTAESLPEREFKALSAIAAVHPHMPTILVTKNAHTDLNREALRKGASDVILRPFSSAELPLVIERNLERRRLERNRLAQRSTGMMLQAIDALVAAVDSRDHFTVGHTHEVTALSLGIADQLRVSQEERAALELAAKLHDVGKLALPDTALNKQSELTAEEWAAMREHPVLGSRIVSSIDELAYVSTVIRHHHERLDGTGYPDGLRGQAIPYLSRIIAVADAYEAMTSDRSHRTRMTAEEAIAELRRNEGVHYETEIINALEEHLSLCLDVICRSDSEAA